MRRRIITLSATVGVVAAAATVTTAILVAGPWTDAQTTSGSLTAAAGATDMLYICEPASPGSNNGTCAAGSGDDSGADEIIFETDEQMIPTSFAFKAQDIVLKNLHADTRFEISDAQVTFTETLDPGADCNGIPSYSIYTSQSDDDHFYASSPVPIPFFAALNNPGNGYKVHVEPSQSDDMQIRMWLPANTPEECEGGAWDVSIIWTAEIH